MEITRKKALMEASLERAAETLGDITPHVLRAFDERLPGARAHFAQLGADQTEKLEQEMVAQALFCLMDWFDNRHAIEIVFAHSVPHHVETLAVDVGSFAGLVSAVADTILSSVPADAHDERAVWRELCADMIAVIEACAPGVS